MTFDSINDLWAFACRDKYAQDGRKKKIGDKNAAGDKIKYREGYGAGNWKPIAGSRKERPIKPVIVSATQEVTKRDSTGKVIDASWTIDKGTEITECYEIASGTGIDDVNRLVRQYPGTTASDWKKQKGVGTIKPKPGTKDNKGALVTKPRQANLHWYFSKKTRQVEIKRKGWIKKWNTKK